MIARRVAEGEITARRSVEEAIDRASAERLNAFLSLRGEKALEEAANGMQNVNSAADWVQKKADLVAKVSSACGG